MWLDPKRYEIVEPEMVEVLRAKTMQERLAIVNGMWRMARDFIRDALRHEHPDWSAEQLARETARKLSHRAF